MVVCFVGIVMFKVIIFVVLFIFMGCMELFIIESSFRLECIVILVKVLLENIGLCIVNLLLFMFGSVFIFGIELVFR